MCSTMSWAAALQRAHTHKTYQHTSAVQSPNVLVSVQTVTTESHFKGIRHEIKKSDIAKTHTSRTLTMTT